MNQVTTTPKPKTKQQPPASRGRIMDFAPRRPQPAPKPQPKPQSQPAAAQTVATVTRTTVTEVAYQETASRPAPQAAPQPKPDAPDANRYALGGKSPFLTSVEVPKRPLNPEHHHAHSPKNVYPPRPSTPAQNAQAHSTIITPSSKKSKAPFAILIFFTIILGAVAGAVVYFLFFAANN